MKIRFVSLSAVLALALSSLPAHAQSGSGGGFPLGGLLLLAVIAGVAWMLLRRRPEPPPPPSNPYARDDAFGRDPYAGMPPQGMPGAPGQDGMGSSIARGVATGLAVGAGAVIAQEFGRRMFEDAREGAPPAAHDAPRGDHGADHAANTHSPLARDAGLGAVDGSGAQGFVDDPDFNVADAGGWDDAGSDDAGGDWDR